MRRLLQSRPLAAWEFPNSTTGAGYQQICAARWAQWVTNARTWFTDLFTWLLMSSHGGIIMIPAGIFQVTLPRLPRLFGEWLPGALGRHRACRRPKNYDNMLGKPILEVHHFHMFTFGIGYNYSRTHILGSFHGCKCWWIDSIRLGNRYSNRWSDMIRFDLIDSRFFTHKLHMQNPVYSEGILQRDHGRRQVTCTWPAPSSTRSWRLVVWSDFRGGPTWWRQRWITVTYRNDYTLTTR